MPKPMPMRTVQGTRTKKIINLVRWRYNHKTDEWLHLQDILVFCTVRRNDIVIQRQYDSVPLRFSNKTGELINKQVHETDLYSYSVDLETLRKYEPDPYCLS